MADISNTGRAEVEESLEIVVEAVEAAGEIALSYFRQPLGVADKSEDGRFDPVTTADLHVERFLRSRLELYFPDDGLLGEEEMPKQSRNGRHWIIDPIDGTRAFISGAPAWGILVGMISDGIPVAGVMHHPCLGETFVATPQQGWFRRGRQRMPLRASLTEELSRAILYSTDPAMFRTARERSSFSRIRRACRMTRYGGDCYSYGLLAMGHIDLVIDNELKNFDILPLIPILEAAGAVVTDIHGAPVRDGGFVVAAATRELSKRAIALLRDRCESG